MESSLWFTRWAPSLATPQEFEILRDKYDPWMNRGQPKLKSSEAKAKAKESIFDQPQVPFQPYENQQVPCRSYLNRNQANRFFNQAQVQVVQPSSIPYRNNQDLLFDARRYKPRRRTDDSGMDRRKLKFVREDSPIQRTAKTLEDEHFDFVMQLAREKLGQNCLQTRQQNIPKPQGYAPPNAQRQQKSKEKELMSQKRDHKFPIPRFVAGSLYNPTFVDYNDTSLPMSSSVLLRSPSDDFSRRSTSPYVASSSRSSVEAIANSSNSVTHDQQHTLSDNFEAFLLVNDLEQNIRELSDFLGLPDDSQVETSDNNAGDLNDDILQYLDFSDYNLDQPMTESENITVDCSNRMDEINQNQINIENNNALNQDEFGHNNDNANNSSSAKFFPSCVGDELAILWGISCDP